MNYQTQNVVREDLEVVENNKDDIKLIFKFFDDNNVQLKEYFESVRKYFKKYKQLSDKQFEILHGLYKQESEKFGAQ